MGLSKQYPAHYWAMVGEIVAVWLVAYHAVALDQKVTTDKDIVEQVALVNGQTSKSWKLQVGP